MFQLISPSTNQASLDTTSPPCNSVELLYCNHKISPTHNLTINPPYLPIQIFLQQRNRIIWRLRMNPMPHTPYRRQHVIRKERRNRRYIRMPNESRRPAVNEKHVSFVLHVMLLLLLLLHGLEEGLLEAAVVVGDHGCVIIVVHRVGREVVHRRATRSARVPGIVHGRYVAIVDVAVVAVVLGVCDVDVVNVVRDDDVGVVNVVPNSSTSARSTNE
mmetsp:Transcript_33622/g.72712  ORF Transcript_33622/g.72712 Transcript_33622/m.72712 type:complete len:216 (-) Transcript_33622:205-852(-)